MDVGPTPALAFASFNCIYTTAQSVNTSLFGNDLLIWVMEKVALIEAK